MGVPDPDRVGELRPCCHAYGIDTLPADLQLLDWAEGIERPVHVLLSKSDQLKRNEARELLVRSVATLAGRASAQLFSARAGTGEGAFERECREVGNGGVSGTHLSRR